MPADAAIAKVAALIGGLDQSSSSHAHDVYTLLGIGATIWVLATSAAA